MQRKRECVMSGMRCNDAPLNTGKSLLNQKLFTKILPDTSAWLGSMLANTCYFIPRAEKWMLGILLSSAMQFYVRKVIGSDEGGFIRLFSIHVEKFPVPAASPEKQKVVERLVDRILAAKQRDAEADVSAWEREIDQLVYALYGLTPEKIKIVEDAAK